MSSDSDFNVFVYWSSFFFNSFWNYFINLSFAAMIIWKASFCYSIAYIMLDFNLGKRLAFFVFFQLWPLNLESSIFFVRDDSLLLNGCESLLGSSLIKQSRILLGFLVFYSDIMDRGISFHVLIIELRVWFFHLPFTLFHHIEVTILI